MPVYALLTSYKEFCGALADSTSLADSLATFDPTSILCTFLRISSKKLVGALPT